MILYQLLDIALAGDYIGKIQLGKFDLTGRILKFTLSYHPVIQRPVILKLQRTDGMSNMLNGILDGVGKVIHRINAPRITRIVMLHVGHAVNDRISHINIGRSHINLGAEHLFAVFIFSFLHLFKKTQVLLNRAVPVRTFLSGVVKVAPVLPDLLCRQVADKGLALFDQKHSALVHLLKIIRGKEKTIFKISAQPLYIRLDRLHKLHLFLGGIGIVKTEIKGAAVLLSQPII